MSKPSRGGPRYAAGKKKAKKRPDAQSAVRVPSSGVSQEPVQSRADAGGGERPSGTVLQFRPRGRESAALRPGAARVVASARALQQAVDYGYVYTDLKIIGGLSAVLFGGLIALSLFLR